MNAHEWGRKIQAVVLEMENSLKESPVVSHSLQTLLEGETAEEHDFGTLYSIIILLNQVLEDIDSLL